MTSHLDAIRAKVEEVRKNHYGVISAPPSFGTIAFLDNVDICKCGARTPRGMPCETIRWAEAALKLAKRWDSLRIDAENALAWYGTSGMKPSKPPMWNVSQAKELEWTANAALADILSDGK